jgi:hypothetical protein
MAGTMSALAAFVLPLTLAVTGQATAASPVCIVQPLPPAIDAIPPPAPAASLITFAAAPWEYPGRAWVVRVSRRGGAAPGSLEIIRLRRQSDCNRYDVERSWTAAISAAEYDALGKAIAPLASPPTGVFSQSEPMKGPSDIVLDGTGLELRLRRDEWEVRRASNHYARAGGEISALFRRLVMMHVPAAELPEEDWRTRREQ